MEQQPIIVARENVLTRLRARDWRLVLVHASAGYGKTTLLSHWAQMERDQDERVVVMSVEAKDDHPDPFFTKLSLAVAREEGLPEEDRLFGSPVTVGEQAITLLCQQLAQGDRRWLLLFDDYHLAQSGRVAELMTVFLRIMPLNVRVGIASRARPSLPFAAMLAAGQILEIEPDDLRLDAADMRKMFACKLSTEDIGVLIAKTEGWPIAVQMARVLATQRKNPATFIRGLEGSEQNISHYLSSEVFGDLSPECQNFLVETSCLEGISEGLADFVREQDNSWRYLEELDAIRAFFVPFRRGNVTWYRHHPMFGEFLQRLFMRKPLVERRALHRRAANWHAENSFLTQAIAHSCEADDVGLANDILSAAGGATLGLRLGTLVLRQILELLPEEWIFASPGLLLARSVLLAKEGRPLDARECVEEAQRVMPSDAPAGLRRSLLFADMLTQTYLDATPPRENLTRTEALLQEVPLSDHWFRGWINNVLCMLHYRQGDLTSSHRFASAAMAHYRDADSIYTEFFMYLHIGLVLSTRGAFGPAYEAYRSALRIARQRFPADASIRAITRILIAELLCERNHLEAAERLLEESLPFLENYEGWTEIYSIGYLTAASVAYNRKGLAPALAVLDRADDVAAGRRLVRLGWMVAAKRVELLARAGDASAAAESAVPLRVLTEPSSEVHLDPAITWSERQATMLACARLALRDRRPSDAIATLASPGLLCQAGTRPGFECRSLLLLALAELDLGNDRQAIAQFAKLLSHPVGLHYPRVLLDDADGVEQLRERCEERATLGDVTAQECLHLLSRHRSFAHASARRTSHNLTHREKQMLSEISRGRTNKMIARDMRLTERTIKFHLQNLYSKLGAANRIEAAHLAREAGLSE